MAELENVSDSTEEKIDIKSLIKKFTSYWYYFILSASICFFVAFLYNRYTRQVYNVSATIVIRDDNNTQLGVENIIEGMEMFSMKTNLENEKAILKSYHLAERTIKKLNLGVSYFKHGSIQTVNQYKISPFNAILDSTHLQLAGIEFFVTPISAHSFNLEFECKQQNTYDIIINKKNNKLQASIKYDNNHSLGESILNDFLSFKLMKTPEFEKEIGETIEKIDSTIKRMDILKQDTSILFFKIKHDTLQKKLNQLKGDLKKLEEKNTEFKEEDIGEQFSFILHSLSNLQSKYVKALTVTPESKESSVLKLSMKGYTRKKNIDYLNTLSSLYIQQGLENKNQMATNTIYFIEDQILKTEDTLSFIENKLKKFKEKNPTLDVYDKDYGTFFQKQRTEGNVSQYQVHLNYYKELLSYLQNSEGTDNIISPTSMGISNPELNSLISQFIILNSKKKELELSTKESHPKYQSVLSQISYTKQSIIENTKNLITSTNSAKRELEGRINNFDKEIEQLPESEKEYVKLKREFMQAERIVNYLILKKQETAIAKEGTQADHEILDEAGKKDSETPLSPKKTLNYIFALLIGIGVPISIVSLKDFFNETIRSKSDLTKITNIPIIGVIGNSERANFLAVLNNPKSVISESFRSLRTNIQYLASDKKNKVITITSSVGSEGKTFCSSNLALIIATAGYKTILIGADLRKPKTHKDFNINNSSGLSSYLINKSSLSNIIHKTNTENLSVISSGPIPPNPAELLNSDRMKELISKLKKTYDYIIMDTPPAGLVTDSVITMKLSDITLYVVRHNYTKKNMINVINNLYNSKQVENTNIIINDYIVSSSSYGYGYGYGYEYEKGYGYYE